MLKIIFDRIGAYSLPSWTDFVQFAISTVAIYLLSALIYVAIYQIQDNPKHEQVAYFLDAFRDFVDMLLLFEYIVIMACFWLWWMRLVFDSMEYLIWKKQITTILPDTIHFILLGFANAMFKILDFIGKKYKAFNYQLAFTPKLKIGKHR